MGLGRGVSFTNVEHVFHASTRTAAPVQVLERTELTIEGGEFVALVGPSGCGKTTLLNMVAGLLEPSTGDVLLGGRPPKLGDPSVGYLLARDSLLPWRTAVENVALPLEIRGVSRHKRLAIARQSLADVGLADFADAYPSQLSHGMRQRTAVARTLSTDPDILLMDEPFSALDAQTRLLLQEQFTTLWERIRPTVVFVTHDLGEAIALADRLIVMTSRPGKIKADLEIDLGRPRHVVGLQGNKDYHDLYQEVWNVFQDEVTAQIPSTGSPAAA